tara:strand:- start:1406 stop:1714 length:309 start_codon:yes stop_codon:yes gene_type:complete
MTEQELGAAMLAFEINAGRTDPRIKIREAADRRGVPLGNSHKRVLKYLQAQVEPVSAKVISQRLNVSSHQAAHWLRQLCDKGVAQSAKITRDDQTLYQAVMV